MKKKHLGRCLRPFSPPPCSPSPGDCRMPTPILPGGRHLANAQTGNIVLLSQNLFSGNWGRVLHYLFPLCAFGLGVAAAEAIRWKFQKIRAVHWRRLVLLVEILLLLAVGLLSQPLNMLANALVSFACAMQVRHSVRWTAMPLPAPCASATSAAAWNPSWRAAEPRIESSWEKPDIISP